MLRFLLFIIILLQYSVVYAQSYFSEFIDSTIGRKSFSEKDWAIGIATEQAVRIPITDSLGNIYSEADMDCTILIFSINNVLYLQKFEETYNYIDWSKFYSSKRIKLTPNTFIQYTVDSILKANGEYIYPYIFSNDSVAAYDFQQPSLHSPHYNMYFKTKSQNMFIDFYEIYLEEKRWFYPLGPKNLNFKYNTKTFIYRAYTQLQKFFEEYKELIPANIVGCSN